MELVELAHHSHWASIVLVFCADSLLQEKEKLKGWIDDHTIERNRYFEENWDALNLFQAMQANLEPFEYLGILVKKVKSLSRDTTEKSGVLS